MDIRQILEKLLIISIILGVFLPLRLFMNIFVSEHWIGSLGLITALTLLFTLLITKNKLGRIGRLIEKHMLKSIRGKTGKIIIVSCLVFLMYFGGTLILIERANTLYVTDKEHFSIAFRDGDKIDESFLKNLNGPIHHDNQVVFLTNLDYGVSISYAVLNDLSDGWLEHLFIILMIEQIEVVVLFIFYRKINFKLNSKTRINNTIQTN